MVIPQPTEAPRRAIPRTPFGAIAAACWKIVDDAETLTWPSPRYRNDPVQFSRDVLGVEPTENQVLMLESLRDNRNTTARSGHKCGKTTGLAIGALWAFCTFERARILMTAVKVEQVDQTIWKEVKRLYREAKIPIGGQLAELAKTGLKSDDGRQIWGSTAGSGEGAAGISGPNVFVFVDECSGVKDQFFEVLDSSLAGSGDPGDITRKFYISNPTRTVGEFYRSHTSNAHLYKCLHFSSEDTPNARGTGMVRGLAGPAYIAEKKLEYGEDSARYQIRIKGNFVLDRDGKIMSRDTIANAQLAWDDMPELGQLQIGIDPAGDGVKGDESAHAVRRGMKQLTVLAERGMSEPAIVARALDLLKTHSLVREHRAPRIVVDVGGGIGTRVGALLAAHLETHPGAFELVQVRAEKIAWGSADYHTNRDALWGECGEWLKAGAAIIDDVKLEEELNAPSFSMVKGKDGRERYAVTSKKDLREILQRSPDRADATCLSAWGWKSDHEDPESEDTTPARARAIAAVVESDLDDDFTPTHDPYAGASAWGGL